MYYQKTMIEEDLWNAYNLCDNEPEEPPAVINCMAVREALAEKFDENTLKAVMDKLEEVNRKR